ncbi:nucleotidyltransferase family protein [Phytomonospora sp. NPDC050363]|uniref:nucleotidyltransferase family protein n=1 Tax=Phytomonospora sp. NPDC050363 TaxID=3155642 RepID=UPI0033C4D60A
MRSRPRVAGLLLAAGAGRRLGGRPKALLRHRGRSLAEHAAANLADGGCDTVHIVLGASAAEIPTPGGCHRVVNPDWSDGMGSSLRAGLAALPEDAEAVVVLLVDQPGITPAAVARVIAAHREGAELAVAAYEGATGHPVLFTRAHFPGVARLAVGDAGARGHLRAHADRVVRVPCHDVAYPADVDTPADLRLLIGGGPAAPTGSWCGRVSLSADSTP